MDLRSRLSSKSSATAPSLPPTTKHERPSFKTSATPKKKTLMVDEDDEEEDDEVEDDNPPFPTKEEEVPIPVFTRKSRVVECPEGITRIYAEVAVKLSRNYNSYESRLGADMTTGDDSKSVEEARSHLVSWLVERCGATLAEVLDAHIKE